ncbi:MAG TPA: site-2 protease family protein [Chloroflexi bacterium]|nr:site-2 protease family protein [Chloroflexota bacterium]
MGKGIRIGRLFGINIRIDWSWLFIFLLITWNLATVFGQAHSEWSVLMHWGMAAVAALLFFASVLAHELAHSLVAQAQGIPVRSITLHLFGGVSSIQREPDSPGSEFVMAILGPITSLVIGGVLLLIAGIAAGLSAASVSNIDQALSQMGPGITLLSWLGSVNVILGIFNLIPGFPLDGGRVLRSILWTITDDLRRATQWASWVGQAIAWVMIVTGIGMAFGVQVPIFGQGLINGLWLAFIGWFLNTASAQSYQRLLIKDALSDISVSRIMRSDPPTTTADISIDALVHNHIMQSDDQAFPVLDEGEFVGIVTLDDVRSASRNTWQDKTVREIMTPREQLVTSFPDECADEAMNKLTQRNVRQLPVLQDDGSLAGVLRRQDLIKWLQLESDLTLH